MKKYTDQIFMVLIAVLLTIIMLMIKDVETKLDDIHFEIVGSHEAIITEIYRYAGAG